MSILSGVSIQGVYGHEQRHIESYLQTFYPVWLQKANDFEARRNGKHSRAVLRSLYATGEIDFFNAFDAFDMKEKKHSDKGGNPPPSPKTSTEYDPIGVMPGNPSP